MNREDEIRKLAHELWEKEGRPEGRALEHWTRASAMISAPAPAAAKVTTKVTKKPVAAKPAAIKPAAPKKADAPRKTKA